MENLFSSASSAKEFSKVFKILNINVVKKLEKTSGLKTLPDCYEYNSL